MCAHRLDAASERPILHLEGEVTVEQVSTLFNELSTIVRLEGDCLEIEAGALVRIDAAVLQALLMTSPAGFHCRTDGPGGPWAAALHRYGVDSSLNR